MPYCLDNEHCMVAGELTVYCDGPESYIMSIVWLQES